jgi:predicted nucleic acid-binding protein
MNADKSKAFLDTNIFIYMYSNEEDKKKAVYSRITIYEKFISTQVLNEFCNVSVKKLKIPQSITEKG